MVHKAFEIADDWRSPENYAHLLDADRSLFAWEWLRRDPAYRAAAATREMALEKTTARRFGLVRFESPDAPVPRARPLWLSEFSSQVLLADISNAPNAQQTFELERFSHLASIASDDEADHLLLSDGLRAIRVDAPLGTFGSKRKCLRLRIGGLVLGDLSVLALRQLLALVRCGRFAQSLHPREARARRWILQLRAHDALESGANLREIAQELLGRSAAGPAWRSRDPSLRSQAQRLVHSARALANGGFRELLSSSTRSRSAHEVQRSRRLSFGLHEFR